MSIARQNHIWLAALGRESSSIAGPHGIALDYSRVDPRRVPPCASHRSPGVLL
jgi:hypothetical protein